MIFILYLMLPGSSNGHFSFLLLSLIFISSLLFLNILTIMDTPNRIQSPPFTLLFFHLLIHNLLFLSITTSTATIPHELTKGFTSTPDPTVTNFQPLLTDHTGNYSLSFLRVNANQLALTIIHVPSGLPLWQPGPAHLAHWGPHTQLLFNGTLVLTDPTSGVFWSSTHTTGGDQVSLTTSSNLQIWRRNSVLLWQSFDFPYNTLMENQNFTSAMQLVSSNGLYTMRLGPDYIGLYAKFKLQGGDPSSNPDQIYFRHRALQAKANILVGHGPVQVRISSDGFLGMYQNGSIIPADVQPFNSYLRSVPGPRRVRIESDGNLKGYYWSGSGWELDYQAIHDPCDLPSPCGPYGLCQSGGGCSCLDSNKTQPRPGECNPTRPESGDLCGGKRVGYRVLRRTNVELPFKDLMVSTRTYSYGLCESLCTNNCTCWGALYNNASGLCYTVDYPIETMVEVGDESKMGYFKVWEGPRKKGGLLGFGVIGIGLLCGGIIVLLSVLVIGGSKLWKFKNRKKDMFLDGEDIVYPGHYKDLGSQSFGSIELSGNR